MHTMSSPRCAWGFYRRSASRFACAARRLRRLKLQSEVSDLFESHQASLTKKRPAGAGVGQGLAFLTSCTEREESQGRCSQNRCSKFAIYLP